MKPSCNNVRSWVSSPRKWVALVCCNTAGLAFLGNASATIVYSGEQNIAITQDFDGVFINVSDFQSGTSASPNWDLNPFFGGHGIANTPGFQPVRIGTGNEHSIFAFGLGSSIGGTSTFSTGWGGSEGSGTEDNPGHLGTGASQFTSGQIGYMGFKLIRDGTVNYGWMRLILTQNGDAGSILDWAYDSSGNPILSGSLSNLGENPTISAAGTSQTLSASEAGSGILMESGAQLTFSEGSDGGEFAGKIDGAGEILISGAGGLRLSGENSFSGAASVLEGSRLIVGNAGNLGSAEVRIGDTASLVFDSLLENNGVMNTFSNTISADGPSATLDNNGTGKVILNGLISSNGGSLEFSGGSFDVQSGITGTGSLLKEGSGTLTLSGENSYTGDTTVRSGALIVNGVLAASDVVVESGGMLKGSGTIGGDVTIASGGTLAPGNSPGVVTIAGTYSPASGSIFAWELDTSQVSPETNIRGTAYDGVNATAIEGSGVIFKIMLTGTQNFTDSFWNQNREWTDIFKTADDGTNLADWALVFGGGFQYYNSGKDPIAPPSSGSFSLTGNTLSWSAVPEPSNLLAGILAASALLRRRRVA